MKKIIALIVMVTVCVAGHSQNHSQNYSSHTFHWGDGTSTTVRTINNSTYVSHTGVTGVRVWDTEYGRLHMPDLRNMPETGDTLALFSGPREIAVAVITGDRTAEITMAEGCDPEMLYWSLTAVDKSDPAYGMQKDIWSGMSERQLKKKYGYSDIEYHLAMHAIKWHSGCTVMRK